MPCPCSQQEFNSPPTWQEFLITRQIVDAQKVPGQAKRRPLHNQGPVLSLDLFGDDVEGTEGGNSDSLQVEENGRAEGLRLKEGLGVALCRACASGPAVSAAAVQRCRPGQVGENWEGACLLSLPLPSKPQHSSPGRRSLMQSRGFQQLGSALRYTATCHERYCTCGRPIGTSQGLWGAVSCFPGRRRGTALRGPGPRGLPSPPSRPAGSGC